MKNKVRIVLVLSLIIFLISYFTYWNYRIKNYEIKGIIETIAYNDKGYPSVIINKVEYGLPFGKEEIKIGDSLSKNKGSFWIHQYRNNNQIGSFEW